MMHLLPLFAALPLVSSSAMRLASRAPDFLLGDILSPVVDFLECTQANPTVKRLCEVIAAEANAQLASASLTISKNGLLFSYDDPDDIKISTGHSCTVTAKVQRTRASAKLGANAFVDFSGNPLELSDPAVVVAELPVTFDMRYDVKERFGTRVLGSCASLGSDSFSVSGSLQTTARVATMFTFAPSLRTDMNGDYVLTIRPIIKVVAQLLNTDIDFDISGVSPLNGLATVLLGGTSSVLQAFTSILKGDSLGTVWNHITQSVIDIGLGIVLSTPLDLFDDAVEFIAQAYVDSHTSAAGAKFSSSMQDTLATRIATALRLDANGERHFVVRKNFVDLLNQFGDAADIFLPEKRPGYCASHSDCDDGVFCNGAERCVNEVCVSGSRPCIFSESDCNERLNRCVMNCGGNTGRICPRDEGLLGM